MPDNEVDLYLYDEPGSAGDTTDLFSAVLSAIPASGNATQAVYSVSGPGSILGSGGVSTGVNFGGTLSGAGFTYSGAGLLTGGVITGIDIYGLNVGGVLGDDPVTEIYTGLQLPVQNLPLYDVYGVEGDADAGLLNGTNQIVVNTKIAVAYYGNNNWIIQSNGVLDPAGLPASELFVSVDDIDKLLTPGGGVNTAAFDPSYGLRSAAQIIYQTYDDDVQVSFPVTATSPGLAVDFNTVDSLIFPDGTLFLDNETAGAQAALMFEGIFGRLPDAVNAGGFAQVADQSGIVEAGNLMLATPEGSADTNGLTDTGFVTRLYENILDRAPDPTGLSGWVTDLSSGLLTRAGVAADFAASPEAQTVNATTLNSLSLFAANPNAVDVLRAYEVLPDRLPETSSLLTDTLNLDAGVSLHDFYSTILGSVEFAGDGRNAYGITETTPYATVYDILHSAAVSNLIAPLITSAGGVGHQAG
jgi:hypothetical protein